ncbi:ABC transporter substrate-binding protein [Paenibacillaceae bacterium WGS1546]|uniref:ABC transporter substrate-binding protein n=1 Tax=Cohnella sp. WGS1546 TaxID=3366810 RepID=UPI00372CFB4A
MQHKKWATTALIATTAFGIVLAGCSGGSNGQNGASPGATTPPQTSGGSQTAPAEITFLTYDGKTDKEGKSLRQLQVDAFNAANPDIVVKLDLQQGDSVEFLKKLDLMSLGGATYDVVALPSYKDYAERAMKGLFAPIDDLIAADGQSYDEVYQYTADVNGVNYGLPYNPSIYFVLLNQQLLEEANLPVPPVDWTWDDYREYAKAMTTGEGANKIHGSYMHTWSEYRREALFSTKLDNPYVKEDGSSNMADPAFKEWLQFIHDMENVDNSQVKYRDAKSTNMAYRDVYFSGKAGMILTGAWILSDVVDTENFPRDFSTAFAMMPRWQDGPAGRVTGSATFNAINKDSKHLEASYRFMKFMSGEGAAIANEFSAMSGADNTATVEAIAAGNEAVMDKQSLLNIMNYEKLEPNSIISYPEQFAKLDALFNVETEKFMVGGQDLDTTINNLIKQFDSELK